MKSILKKTITKKLELPLERELELTQDLFWMFVDERIKTLQEKHETFEEFLTLLDQLIESETKRKKQGRSVHFATNTTVKVVERYNHNFEDHYSTPTPPEHFLHHINYYY